MGKLARVDWFGNLIVIVGTTLSVVGLTWAGIRFPWSSPKVLVPLILGLALVGVFILYEARVPREPTIPWVVLNNRTSFSAFMATMIHGITSISLIYYMPVYFQSVLEAGPIKSGIDMLGVALIMAPFALMCGISIQVLKRYLPANYAGWIVSIIGFGLLSLLKADSSTGKWVGFQLLAAAGTGFIYAGTLFPVLAPLPLEQTAAALAFFAFLRAFAQTWGITICGTILQNQLKHFLPTDFSSQFPQGVEIAYAIIPEIKNLPEPLRDQVRAAFASSMSTIWKVMIAIAGLGLITVFFTKEVPMHEFSDDKYALEGKEHTSSSNSKTAV